MKLATTEELSIVYTPLVFVPRPPRRINTSNHTHVTYQGKTATYREWAEKLGVPRKVVYDRLNRYGWTIEEALTTPKR